MKKRIITLFCVVLLTAAMLIGATTVTASKLKTTPKTIREYLVSQIAEMGSTVSTDAQIKNYIKDHRSEFFDLDMPESVTGFDGMSLLFEAMGDETCTVTFNCEEQSDFNLLLNEVKGKDYNNNKCVKFGKTVWDYTLVVDASGLDVQPRFQRQRPYLKETAHFQFIDAIPAKFSIPVPIRVLNNSKAVLGTEKPTFNNGGIGAYDKDPSGVKVTRNEELIVIEGLKTAAEISSEYGAVWYTKDGSAPGTSPAANQVSYTFKTSIGVLYSVSFEPITDGAKDGTPTLKLDGKLVSNSETTPKAEVPEKDEFGRSLGNTASLINRGTNSNQDKIGSNANGADVRSAGRANVATGKRSTGFAEYGKKIEVAPNPDTANGFEVAYYNIEIYDPITCELMKSESHLSESQLKTILNKGVQGKTKIYVAYTNTIGLVKTDAQGNAIKGLSANDAPVFGIYTDKECKNLIANLTYDAATGVVKTPALDLPVPGDNENVKTYYIKEIKAPKGYVLNPGVYTLEMKHTASGLIKSLTDAKGNIVTGDGEADPYVIVNYKVGYTMVKYRVTQYNKNDISKGKGKKAGDKTDGVLPYDYNDKLTADGGERGFYAGNTVVYNVEFRNTGDVELTINVKDVFEAISKGGFEFSAVKAECNGKALSVNGKDATTFTLPVDKAGTSADESLVIVTFTCKIKNDTPAKEEQSTGKTGYAVAGYENTATSTATFVSPYDGTTVIKYAEDKDGNVVPEDTQGAQKEKKSIAYTPVMVKGAPAPEPTPTPLPGDYQPKTGDRTNSLLAIILVVLAVVVVGVAIVLTIRNNKRNNAQ